MQSIKTLLAEYPILFKTTRNSMFEPIPNSVSPLQKYLIIPSRIVVSFFTGVILLRSTFGPTYIEDDLRPGIISATPILFETLDRFDGDENSEKGKRLVCELFLTHLETNAKGRYISSFVISAQGLY
jgi:hypothetical protein